MSCLGSNECWAAPATVVFTLLFLAFFPVSAKNTPTENLGISIPPAPGKVTIDGRFNDWDLSGSLFASANVETQRDDYSVWLSTMYDNRYLYILARFNDKTPLNNPGLTFGSYGWNGDCLQIRTITHPGTGQQLIANITAWKGHDGSDVIGIDYNGGPVSIANAKSVGAQQAFLVNPDKSGYAQEIAIPWALLTKDGKALEPEEQFRMTFEPNFTVGSSGRWSVKDVFQPDMPLDRVFTFMNSPEWGVATLLQSGHIALRPVRIAGGRTFPVSWKSGVPQVNWTGLIEHKVLIGFKNIAFALPSDGSVSLNIYSSSGQLTRQLINGEIFSAGKHNVLWDGLTTPNYDHPGDPVKPGKYSYRILFNGGLSLKLRGWADNAGSAPWDNGPTTNWGGDHGVPSDCASDSDRVYLGWSEAESGKAVIATDHVGNVLWRNPSGPLVEANLLTVSDGVLYVGNSRNTLFRLKSTTGAFTPWSGMSTAVINPLTLWNGIQPSRFDGLASGKGKVFVSFSNQNTIVEIDGDSGAYVSHFTVPSPGMMKFSSDGSLYIVSKGSSVVRLDPADGSFYTVIGGLSKATGLALGPHGECFVGLGDPVNQVDEFDSVSKLLRTFGSFGGRPIGAAWNHDGLRYISGMTIDNAGNLWVAESNDLPKRVSEWNATTGEFEREFFGPTHYGAVGGSIDPRDPNIMVGSGCEWTVNPATGKAVVDFVFPQKTGEQYSDNGIGESAFGIGSNGRLYLALSPAGPYQQSSTISIYERLGLAKYILRTTISVDNDKRTTAIWSDKNGDGVVQPADIVTYQGTYLFTGWYLDMSSSLAFFGNDTYLAPSGFTKCGAPAYDLDTAVRLPMINPNRRGIPSADGKKLLVENGQDGDTYATFDCYDLVTKRKLWSYPDNYVSVHGSHNAPPSSAGKIYGSYGPVSCVVLSKPIGNVWFIPTNVGEWHLLTEDGFYLSNIFQPDPLKVNWPTTATPGADMTDVPPGGGGEDFGGSVTHGDDGNIYIEAGHTAYWNLQLNGLASVRSLAGGKINLSAAESKRASVFHDDEIQAAQGQLAMSVAHETVQFTGSLDNDFKSAQIVSYEKGDDFRARSTIAFDNSNLYLAWEVQDSTPWKNGADDPSSMYLSGDTVDFQIGTDEHADPNRSSAVLGDERISIGEVNGVNFAELYRKISTEKRPAVFHSGVIKNYSMDYAAPIDGAVILVTKHLGSYVVESSIPLPSLGLRPFDGMKLRGDFGVTFGDTAGEKTRLRSYWSNQHVGIVDDAVFELILEPQYWGALTFHN